MKRGKALKAAIGAASLLPFSGVTYRVTNLQYFETLTGTDGGYRADNRFTRAGLSKALYVCVESAALLYENLKESLLDLGYI